MFHCTHNYAHTFIYLTLIYLTLIYLTLISPILIFYTIISYFTLSYAPVYRSLIISILVLQSASIHALFSLEKITTMLKKTPATQVKQYKYNASQIQTIKLKNISGNIKVRTHTSQQTIFISATKKITHPTSTHTAYTKEADPSGPHLTRLSKCIQKQEPATPFTINSYIKNNTLFIQPTTPTVDCKENIQYHLIIPATTTLFLETDKGSITTQDTYGMITLATKEGDIICTNTHNSLIATVHKKGSINVELASSPIHATTTKGSIHIYDAKDSIYASTQTGKINIHSISLPSNGYLDLKTDTGSIYLSLSKKTYASLHATTSCGNIFSELPVTLQARTTILNNDVWHKVKQEVKGTLGQKNSEPSKSIILKNNKGTIKIIDSAHF